MSQTGMFMGTAAYAPPEQFFGKKDLDPRSDLYSLGAMLFELATGRVPFQAEAIGDLVRQVLRDKPPRLGTLAPQVTPFFEEVVATLLEKQPERRFATAAELGEVLDAAEAGDWWAATSVRVQMESRRPLRRARVRRETELWGRQDDLAELRSLWDTARAGQGRVVLLEGEPGIGKTRLVEELLAAIEAEDAAQILVGRHDPAGAGSAAEALAAAFREHLGAEDLDGRVAGLLPGSSALLPAFAALLRGEAAPPGAQPLSPPALRALFADLARALAAEAPLVLVVDDLHFATDEGRALFRAVAFAVAESPVLLVGTARRGLPGRWAEEMAGLAHAVRHEVSRLDEATVRAALLRHLGGDFAAEAVAEKVATRAGGNPYFVVEALRLLGERGHIARTGEGSWRVTSVPGELALPATVRDLVAGRLAALAPADREIAEAASCQGHEFDGRLVAETLGRPRMDVLRALGRLEHATSLVRAAGTKFAFDHHVVHEVLYAGQAAAAREGRHRAVAAALLARHGGAAAAAQEIDEAVCASVAEHFLRGGDGARALVYLDRGLTHLERGYRNVAMLQLAEMALAVPGLLTDAARAALLLRMVDGPLDLLGLRQRHEEAAREAGRLAAAAGDTELEARSASALGWYFLRAGRIDEVEPCFRRVEAIAEATGSSNGRGVAANGLGNACYLRGMLDDAAAHYRRAFDLAVAASDLRGQAGATINLGNVMLDQGRAAESRALHERGIELARAAGCPPFEANAHANLFNIAVSERRFEDARRHLEAEAAIQLEMGDRGREAVKMLNLAGLFNRERRIAECRASTERCLALCRESEDRLTEALATFNLGNTYADAGDAAAAVPLLERALVMSRELGVRSNVAQSSFLLGTLALDGGDTARARAMLEAARDEAVAIGLAPMDVLSRARLASLPGGDLAAAERCLVENAAKLEHGQASLGWFYLWQASRDPRHRAEAERLHHAELALVPAEYRAAALRDYRDLRVVAAALAAR
jgi:tetratricopeptide (TPR) repeat protein